MPKRYTIEFEHTSDIEKLRDNAIVFLSGPITGVAGYKKNFEEYQQALEEKGFAVMNPALLPEALTWAAAMRICFAMIREADAVCFLPGWMRSRGSNQEFSAASRMRKIRLFAYGEDDE